MHFAYICILHTQNNGLELNKLFFCASLSKLERKEVDYVGPNRSHIFHLNHPTD